VSADYAALAPIYEEIGLADFTAAFTPRIFLYAQATHDWIGRRVLELGCGTGVASRWLAQRGLNVTAVDMSGDMLTTAQRTVDSSGLGLSWRRGDIRSLDNSFDATDMIIALDVVNDLNNLRDLETMFSTALRLLEPGKLFIFDMLTIEGLASSARESGILHNTPELTVFATRQFDYDRQAKLTNFTIFTRQSQLWSRQDTTQTLRGYPIQAVAALLARSGFTIAALTHLDFEPYDPASSRGDRVVFIARKPEESA
jgi:2-polyprenyl-3-methyl-5-hydroxy-6-metoxy-1,4-benzoquinol methylase